MRINGYYPASNMMGPEGDPHAIGEGHASRAPFDAPVDARTPRVAPPEMAPMLRIEPVAAGTPPGADTRFADTRFLAQLAGQFLDPGTPPRFSRDAYADPLDGDPDERPYWTGRPVKFWA